MSKDGEVIQAVLVSGPAPPAPVLMSIEDNSPFAKAHAVSEKTRFGSEMGTICASQERENIQRVAEIAKEKTLLESQRIAEAGRIANRRVTEGLEMKKDNYFDESSFLEAKKKRDDENNNKPKISHGGGYQVAEYDVKDYVTSNYEPSEYKSIYD